MKVIEYTRGGKKITESVLDKEVEAFVRDLRACGEECRVIDIKERPDPPGKPHFSCSGSGRLSRDFTMSSLQFSDYIPGSDEE